MYRVIRYFEDKQDNNYAYNVGDKFPHDGIVVSQSRINDLMSGNNFQRVQLIEIADTKEAKPETKKEEPKSLTKEDIEKMPFFKLKSVAKSHGIDVTDKKTDTLRKELIEKMEL